MKVTLAVRNSLYSQVITISFNLVIVCLLDTLNSNQEKVVIHFRALVVHSDINSTYHLEENSATNKLKVFRNVLSVN